MRLYIGTYITLLTFVLKMENQLLIIGVRNYEIDESLKYR